MGGEREPEDFVRRRRKTRLVNYTTELFLLIIKVLRGGEIIGAASPSRWKLHKIVRIVDKF